MCGFAEMFILLTQSSDFVELKAKVFYRICREVKTSGSKLYLYQCSACCIVSDSEQIHLFTNTPTPIYEDTHT